MHFAYDVDSCDAVVRAYDACFLSNHNCNCWWVYGLVLFQVGYAVQGISFKATDKKIISKGLGALCGIEYCCFVV